MRFEDMRIVLTGATGGIGQHLARDLAARGAALLLVGRNKVKLTALTRSIREQGGNALPVVANLGKHEGMARVCEAARQLGREGANGLINTAGVNAFGFFSEQCPEAITQTLTTNIVAPVLLTHRLLPLLQTHDEAMIVNVGSILGSIGTPGQAAYSASKFGLHGFTEALRRELAMTGVRVLYVAPRATDTDMNDATMRRFNETTGVTTDAPQSVAATIVRAIGTGKRERFIGWPERLFVKINALFPGLVDRSMHKPAKLVANVRPAPHPQTATNGANS